MPIAHSRHLMARQSQADGCGFCKRNRESAAVAASHQLKDADGRVTCPMLRRYVCAGCGATGDNAHTRSYCPNVISARQQREIQHRRQAQRPSEVELQVNLQDSQQPAAASPCAQSCADQQPHARRAHQRAPTDIELGANRAFYNMSRVTNSRYNSAGWLRDRHRGRQHHQEPGQQLL